MKKLFNILFLFLILFINVTDKVSAKGIKFVQFTDVHYSNSVINNESIDKAISVINNLKDVDFVIFTGDNIDVANANTLELLMARLKKIKKPYYIILGNHDVFKSNGLSKELYMQIVSKNNPTMKTKTPNYYFVKKNIMFVVVDATKEFMPNASGYFTDTTLAWLDNILTKNKNKPVVIFQHYPLLPNKSAPGHNIYKPEPYLQLLSKHNNVIAIIAGHYHKNQEQMINNVYHIVTPEFCNDNPAVKLIEINAQKNSKTKRKEYNIYTQLIHIKDSKVN